MVAVNSFYSIISLAGILNFAWLGIGNLFGKENNVRVFTKAGNSLIFQPGTNALLKICC
jgi:hypothetical protein